MMSALSLRAALLCLMLVHLCCNIESSDANAAPPAEGYAFNNDPNSQTNKYSYEEIQKMVESKCSKLVEDACIKCSEETLKNCGNETWKISPPVLPQLMEKDDKIWDSVVFLHLIKGIAESFTEEQTEQMVITLDSYRIEKLHKFLSDDSGDMPSVDIVHMLTSSLSPLSRTAHAPYSSSWFERTFSVSFIKAAVCLVILVLFAIIFKFLLTGNISYTRLICALLVVVLILNFAWSYTLLYKKKVSERMADDAQREELEEVCHSQKNLGAFQKIKSFFGFQLHKDERCQKLIESYQIHPLLEVHPIEAVTDTFERIITSLSSAFGKSLSNFNSDFFSNLSVFYWIPAMVFNLLLIAVILVVYLHRGKRSIEPRGTYRRPSYRSTIHNAVHPWSQIRAHLVKSYLSTPITQSAKLPSQQNWAARRRTAVGHFGGPSEKYQVARRRSVGEMSGGSWMKPADLRRPSDGPPAANRVFMADREPTMAVGGPPDFA